MPPNFLLFIDTCSGDKIFSLADQRASTIDISTFTGKVCRLAFLPCGKADLQCNDFSHLAHLWRDLLGITGQLEIGRRLA
jgi:hypothetical protein